jgi:dCMP deaminase
MMFNLTEKDEIWVLFLQYFLVYFLLCLFVGYIESLQSQDFIMKNMKNKYDATFMRDAVNWSNESYALRKQVGAIIVRDNRPISNGYNGTVPDQPNECEHVVPVCENCGGVDFEDVELELSDTLLTNVTVCKECRRAKTDKTKLVTNDNVIHAEMNAIAFASKHGIKLDGATLYVTLSPCTNCANMIHAVGIKRVVYLNDYKDLEGVSKLRRYGVEVEKLVSDE